MLAANVRRSDQAGILQPGIDIARVELRRSLPLIRKRYRPHARGNERGIPVVAHDAQFMLGLQSSVPHKDGVASRGGSVRRSHVYRDVTNGRVTGFSPPLTSDPT
jgi:hypothetical protein